MTAVLGAVARGNPGTPEGGSAEADSDLSSNSEWLSCRREGIREILRPADIKNTIPAPRR